MFKLLELKNFRGFHDVQLSGLSRINVVTGVNGSGKTSILEAVFLLCGAANASLALSLNGFRGDTAWGPNYSTPFLSLFKNLDPEIIPFVSASSSILQKRSKKYYRSLEIRPSYSLTEVQAATAQKRQLSGVEFFFTGPSGPAKSVLGWKKKPQASSGKVEQHSPQNANDGFVLSADSVNNKDFVNAHFVSPYVRDLAQQNHDVLTQFVKDRRIKEVVNALNIIHPQILDIVPLTEEGVPVIYADIGSSAMLPISLLGAGVSNVLHIILPLLMYKNAVVLADEFEDGIHHTYFAPLLRLVFKLAQDRNNQIFLSSHSDEFLRVLISISREFNNNDISFFRLGRRGVEGNVPRYSLDDASDLLESNLDIR